MDAFLDFVMPFEGDAYELITAFGLTYSFIVLVAFFILTVMHRIKDDWPINKQIRCFDLFYVTLRQPILLRNVGP